MPGLTYSNELITRDEVRLGTTYTLRLMSCNVNETKPAECVPSRNLDLTSVARLTMTDFDWVIDPLLSSDVYRFNLRCYIKTFYYYKDKEKS